MKNLGKGGKNLPEWPWFSKRISDLPFVFLDLETTGFTPPNAKIIEVAIIVGFAEESKTFHTLVDPRIPIPSKITEITGITDEMVAGKPRIEEILPEIETILSGKIFVSHNVPFDWAFFEEVIKHYLGRDLEMPSLCTLHLSRKYLKLPSHALQAVVQHVQVPLFGAHRALNDTRAVKGLLEFFLSHFEKHGLITGEDLVAQKLIQFQGRAFRK